MLIGMASCAVQHSRFNVKASALTSSLLELSVVCLDRQLPETLELLSGLSGDTSHRRIEAFLRLVTNCPHIDLQSRSVESDNLSEDPGPHQCRGAFRISPSA